MHSGFRVRCLAGPGCACRRLKEILQERGWLACRNWSGGGTNVLFVSDFDGVVIRIEIGACTRSANRRVVALRSRRRRRLALDVQALLDQGIGGLENLSLIPARSERRRCRTSAPMSGDRERLHSVRVWDRKAGGPVQMGSRRADLATGTAFSVRRAGRQIIRRSRGAAKRWQAVLGYADLDRELRPRPWPPGARETCFDAVCLVRRRSSGSEPDWQCRQLFKNPVVKPGKRKPTS